MQSYKATNPVMAHAPHLTYEDVTQAFSESYQHNTDDKSAQILKMLESSKLRVYKITDTEADKVEGEQPYRYVQVHSNTDESVMVGNLRLDIITQKGIFRNKHTLAVIDGAQMCRTDLTVSYIDAPIETKESNKADKINENGADPVAFAGASSVFMLSFIGTAFSAMALASGFNIILAEVLTVCVFCMIFSAYEASLVFRSEQKIEDAQPVIEAEPVTAETQSGLTSQLQPTEAKWIAAYAITFAVSLTGAVTVGSADEATSHFNSTTEDVIFGVCMAALAVSFGLIVKGLVADCMTSDAQHFANKLNSQQTPASA